MDRQYPERWRGHRTTSGKLIQKIMCLANLVSLMWINRPLADCECVAKAMWPLIVSRSRPRRRAPCQHDGRALRCGYRNAAPMCAVTNYEAVRAVRDPIRLWLVSRIKKAGA